MRRRQSPPWRLRPGFYLGLREGEIRELPATGHTRRVVEGERYYRLRENGMAVERRDFLCYDITMGENMDLGERVRVEIHLATPFADMVIKEVIENYVATKAGMVCAPGQEKEEQGVSGHFHGLRRPGAQDPGRQ